MATGVGLDWSGCSFDFRREGNPPTEVNWTHISRFAVEGAGDQRERALQAAEAFIEQNGEEWELTFDSSNDQQRRLKVSRRGMSVRFSATVFPERLLLTVEAVSSCTPVPDDTRERWPQWS